jgi:hypothetical protein
MGDTTEPARVTLVWTDYPATLAASTKLVNDLDLEVIAPNGDVYHGNIQGKNPANFDHLNNVESVDIPVSDLTSGILTVNVSASNIPNGPQPYALAIRYGNGPVNLAVSTNPGDEGTVSPLSGQYDYGSTIILQATPIKGYALSRWSGDVTDTRNPVTLKMDSDKTVVANFVQQGINLGYTQNGTSATVTATMYYNGSPAAGKTITFYNKLSSASSYSSMGTAITNASGVATKTFTAALGSNTTYAKFATAGGIPPMSSDSIEYTVNKVTLTSPATGAAVTTATPTLSWAPFTDATGYHVQISSSSTFAAGSFKLDADTADASTTVDSPALTKGTAYFWRVQALIPNGKSVYPAANKVVYKAASALSFVSLTQDGLKVTIKAALTGELGVPVAGKTVGFYEGATLKASGTTAADGTRTATITSTVGAHTYAVKFNGDTLYAPAAPVDVPVVVKKVTLTSPANGAILPEPQPLLSWSLYSADTSKYHVQVSSSSTFAAGSLKLDADTTDASTTTASPALTKGTAYFWRVQALMPNGKSVYSAASKMVYKAASALSIVSLTQDGLKVRIKAALTGEGGAPVAGKTIGFYEGATSKASGTTAADGTYTATITSTVGTHTYTVKFNGNTVYAAAAPVDVPVVVGKVTLTSPAAGAVVTTATPTLSWAPYTDATGYHVQVSSSSTFAAGSFKLNADTADASTIIVSPALTRGTTYYWRVQALIPTGKSIYSDKRNLVYR